MTPHTTVPLLWDGTGFRPITTLPDLAEWDDRAGRHGVKGTAALLASLEVAVPMRISELAGDVLLWSRVEEWRREALEPIASRGDVLMYGGKRGEAADVFNHLAKALAAMAFLPGGVTFAGLHFEATPPTDADSGASAAASRPVANVLPDLDRWRDTSPERTQG